MNRAEKTAAVERMHADFQRAPHVILASFRGLSVNQANELRRKVGSVGGEYQVIKNRLAKRAAVGTTVEPLVGMLSGPCALALHETDPVALAKALAEFAKTNPELELRGGVVDARDVMDAGDVKHLATLPGLPELRAQLLALIQTPATSIVRLLNTPGGQLARVVDAHREALGDTGAEQPEQAEQAE